MFIKNILGVTDEEKKKIYNYLTERLALPLDYSKKVTVPEHIQKYNISDTKYIFRIAGSFSRSDEFYSDIDLEHHITLPTNFLEENTDFLKLFRGVFDNQNENIKFVSLKAGIKYKKFIPVGYLDKELNLINYYPVSIKEKLKIIYDNGFYDEKTYKNILKLVKDKPSISDYLILLAAIKKEYRLTWTPEDIKRGYIADGTYKYYLDDKQVIHNKCLLTVMFQISENIWVETTVKYKFYFNNIPFVISEKNSNILITIYELYTEKNYLKMLKRFRVLTKYTATLENSKKECTDIVKLIEDEYIYGLTGYKYYLASYLDGLLTLHEYGFDVNILGILISSFIMQISNAKVKNDLSSLSQNFISQLDKEITKLTKINNYTQLEKLVASIRKDVQTSAKKTFNTVIKKMADKYTKFDSKLTLINTK